MGLTFYYHPFSPPVRGVMLLLKALDIEDVEMKFVDIFTNENHTAEFLKINPMHSVPVLKHNDLILTDSHTMMIYLVDTFAPGSSLNGSNDPIKRIKIINMLLFNASFFFRRDSDLFIDILFARRDHSANKPKIEDAYRCLEIFLSESKYIAGDELTIADFAVVTTLTQCLLIYPLDKDNHTNTIRWFEEMKTLPYFEEVDRKNVRDLKKFLKNYIDIE